MILPAFIQTITPDTNTWVFIISTVGGAMSGVFGALLASQRTVNANLEKQVLVEQKSRQEAVASCELRERERVEKVEKREDNAGARLVASTNIVTGMATAITEFGGVLKDTTGEIRRYAERSEGTTREIAELKREAGSLRDVTIRETGELKKEIVDLRRDVSDFSRAFNELPRSRPKSEGSP